MTGGLIVPMVQTPMAPYDMIGPWLIRSRFMILLTVEQGPQNLNFSVALSV